MPAAVALLVLLIVYALLLIGLGLFISRLVRSADDFLVAGRRLNSGLLFATLLTANIGAGSTVGAAGLGYKFGLSAWWWVGSAGIGSIILALTVGPKIWRAAKQHNLYTAGDYLELRYNRTVRLLVAGVLWLGTLALLAAQLIGVAWILNVTANVPKAFGCLIGGIVVIAYFGAGGLLASAWVNAVQLAVLLVGFIIALPVALDQVGSWQAVVTSASLYLTDGAQTENYFSLTGAGAKWVLNYAMILIPSFIISPGLVQKIYGARDPRAVRVGVLANAVCLLVFACIPPLLGMIVFSQFPDLPNHELALPTAMAKLLPGWIGGLALAAIFSAEISTCDAILFMLSTSLGNDLYRRVINPNADQATLMKINRLTAVVSGIVGVVIAIMADTIISALSIFYSLLVAALFVPLIGGLYWPKLSARMATVAIAVSVTITLLVNYMTRGQGFWLLPPAAWGILGSALVIFVDSRRHRIRG
jgi:SSS family solute:Na+ symporter